ncbi:MAG TPA: hypothetical protein VG323_17070 [Thermoanaerobaculia bacterium]|nr:hypothetical protein [Thermoanaerobaculia bacterium]
MSRDRLSLFHYDVVRELCDRCSNERFQFVPTGAVTAPGTCPHCGNERKLADVSDTAIIRLITEPDGEVVVVRATA